jgi:hypothetical protein
MQGLLIEWGLMKLVVSLFAVSLAGAALVIVSCEGCALVGDSTAKPDTYPDPRS